MEMEMINTRIKSLILLLIVINSYVSLPKETVQLSKILGKDLKILHNSHKSMIELYYSKIIDDITLFMDEIYAPFIINYVLKSELKKHKNHKKSIYGIIEAAGATDEKAATDEALNVMTEFLEDANNQINKKKKELLDPIRRQKREMIRSIDKSYQNSLYANTTITGYLVSARKVKESQQKALEIIGLEGKDEELNKVLLKTSEIVKSAITKGKEIDIKSDAAFSKINEISNQIKTITKKIN